ncbi:MAG TPA: S8 family serine peptidase [Gaiellaceae bacterium]|nr:S8 family serine peptidase [Gaiellaceae bacterium]
MAKAGGGGRGARRSALWGSGNRGGERRASALPRGGTRFGVVVLVAAFALLAPLAALAEPGNGQSKLAQVTARASSPRTAKQSSYVPPALLKQAQANGNQRLHVIIQASGGANAAASAFAANGQSDGGTVSKRLAVIDGVAADLKAKWILRLAKVPGLVVTVDAPVEATGNKLTNSQLWPYAAGDAKLWGSKYQPAPDAPTIAIVDSGLDAGKKDFDGRAYPQVNLSSTTPDAQGDGDGHGTFVAGIAAGGNDGYAGASPGSHVLPIRVMDDNGVARTSDVIAAAQWILANKDAYNIKVANFSLHSATATHFYYDPLDRAIEKLWLNGIVVVAAAGNYGTADGPSGVLYSPGNDPFVITVGAVDIGTAFGTLDDSVAPWSAWGSTEDGFAKPELGAPGRYMIGPVSNGSLKSQRPDHVVSPDYMELSGTSFAAPVVAGAAAQLLALHPDWTPDEVKGALMLTAKQAVGITNRAIGVGEVSVTDAAAVDTPPNPNAALDGFLANDPANGLSFDAPTWVATASADASWAAASWADASWASASWSDASWVDAAWTDAAWTDASWADAAWTDASWADAADADGMGPVALADPSVSAAAGP